jgi:AcrR family transcriptional regulator
MSDICQAAGMSAGNLYRYFPSKEAIIAGIAERYRLEAATDFAAVEQAPSFFEGLARVARRHMLETDSPRLDLCLEIMAESRRNPAVASVFADLERDVRARLAGLLKSAAARGEIASGIDLEAAATMLMVIGDGMSWRRAADRDFNPERVMPLMFSMVRSMLGAAGGDAKQDTEQ